MGFYRSRQCHLARVWYWSLSSTITTLTLTERSLSETTSRIREWRGWNVLNSTPVNICEISLAFPNQMLLADLRKKMVEEWELHPTAVCDQHEDLGGRTRLTSVAGKVAIRLVCSNCNHPIHQARVDGNMSCLALTEICQIFHSRKPHTHGCCSSHKCMFFTNVAQHEQTFQCYVIKCEDEFLQQRNNRPAVYLLHTRIQAQ